MRRLLAILLALSLLVFGLCACKDEKPREADGSISFTYETFPKIAVTGATEAAGQIIAKAALGDTDISGLIIRKPSVKAAYDALKNGECSMVIAFLPDSETVKQLLCADITFEMTEFSKDALIFLTNSENKANNLTAQNIKDIYSGKINNWKDLGFEDMGIAAFSATEGTTIKNIFDNTFLPDYSGYKAPLSTIMTQNGEFTAPIDYDNRAGALGYCFYSELSTKSIEKNGKIKVLNIDGKAASNEAILNGQYIWTADVAVSIKHSEVVDSRTRLLYNWILSKQGKEVLKNSGLVIS